MLPACNWVLSPPPTQGHYERIVRGETRHSASRRVDLGKATATLTDAIGRSTTIRTRRWTKPPHRGPGLRSGERIDRLATH